MSIASEITRLQNAKASLKSSINAKTDAQHQIDDETLEDYADFVDSISSGGGNNNGYFDTSQTYDYSSGLLSLLTSIDNIDTSNLTNMRKFFTHSALETIPLLNTSNVGNFQEAFSGCSKLKNIPQFNTSSATTLRLAFQYTPKLTDQSLDNVLKMCINVSSSYARSKTLADLGFTSSDYPASRIQALPSYQDFIDAGWTIGY